MKKPDNLIDFEELIKKDPGLEITTRGVIKWLEKFLPYTERILGELEKGRIDKYPSIIQEYAKYCKELVDFPPEKHELINDRIKAVLMLQNEFYEKNKKDFFLEFESIFKVKNKAMRNMGLISNRTKFFNTFGKNNVPKREIIVFHLNILKDAIEGILKPSLVLILYYLDNKNSIKELNTRYFSEMYFFNPKRIKMKTIESDFEILFENLNTSLRNADAHFDYEIDEKNELIHYKTGSRKNPVFTETSLTELKSEIIKLAGISRQIAIAYELFWYEHQNEFPEVEDDSDFIQELAALNQCLLPKKYVIRKYEWDDNNFTLFIKNYSEDEMSETLTLLLGHGLNYLSLIGKYESPVDRVILNIDESIQLTIEVKLLDELKENTSEKKIKKIFVDSVIGTLEKIN